MKNKIKLMMLFVIIFQIVQPVISGSYIYAQEVKESTKYEKGYKTEENVDEEETTKNLDETRSSEYKDDFTIDDFGVNGEVIKDKFDGKDVLSLNGPNIGGLGMLNYKFDLKEDFNVKLHVDVEGNKQTNGFSFLISPLENVGYYASGAAETAGVMGNKNSFFISRKYGPVHWQAGVYYGVTDSSGDPDGSKTYLPPSNTNFDLNFGDLEMSIEYKASEDKLNFEINEEASGSIAAKDYVGESVGIRSSIGEQAILSVITGFDDARNQDYYVSIDEISGTVSSFFDYEFVDTNGDNVELGDTLIYYPKFKNESNEYNVQYDSSGDMYMIDSFGNEIPAPITTAPSMDYSETIPKETDLDSTAAAKSILIKDEEEVVTTDYSLGTEIGVNTDITTNYKPIGTKIENEVLSGLPIDKRDDVISSNGKTLAYDISQLPNFTEFIEDAEVVIDDKYFLNPETDKKIFDLNLDGNYDDHSPRLNSDFGATDLSTPGTYTIKVVYHTVDDDYIDISIPVKTADFMSGVELTKSVEDSGVKGGKKESLNFLDVKNIFIKKEEKEVPTKNGLADPEEKLTYTYTISNNTDVAFTNITLNDPLDDELNTTTETSIKGFYDANNNGVQDGGESYVTGLGSSLIGGLTVDEVPSKESVVITMEVNAASTFTTKPTIDTLSTLTAPALGSMKIEEKGTTYPANPTSDIEKNFELDPTDGDAGVVFTKAVTDTDDGKAQAGEALHYKYTIENKLPTKASFPITNVVLTDPLDDNDLDLTGTETLTVGGVTGVTGTVADIQSGLTIPQIDPGVIATIEFDISANSGFVDTEGINSIAQVKLDGTSETILEKYDTTSGYADVDPDIEKDISGTDLIINHELIYDGSGSEVGLPGVVSELYTGVNTGDEKAQESEYLLYELTIDNSMGNFGHEVDYNIAVDEATARNDLEEIETYYYSEPAGATIPSGSLSVGAGDIVKVQYYVKIKSSFEDLDNIDSIIDITDEVGGIDQESHVPEISTEKSEGAKIIAKNYQICESNASSEISTEDKLKDLMIVQALTSSGTTVSNSDITVEPSISYPPSLGTYNLTFSFDDNGTSIVSNAVELDVIDDCSAVKNYEISSGNQYYNPPLYVGIGLNTKQEVIGDFSVDLYDGYDEDLCVYIKESSSNKIPTSECQYVDDNTDGSEDLTLISTGGFNPDKIGTYYPVYKGTSISGTEVIGELEVEVIEPQLMAIDDAQSREMLAPNKGQGFITLMSSRAKEISNVHDREGIEHIGDDLSSTIKVTDYGSYNMLNPKIGNYQIEFTSKSPTTGIEITDSAILEVLPDYVEEIHNGDLRANTPIGVKTGTNSFDIMKHLDPLTVTHSNAGFDKAIDESKTDFSGVRILESKTTEGTGRKFMLIETTTDGLGYEEIVEIQTQFNGKPITDEIKIEATNPLTIKENSKFDAKTMLNAHAYNSKKKEEEVKVSFNKVNTRVETEEEPYQVVLESTNDDAYAVELAEVYVIDEDVESPIITANDAQVRSSVVPKTEEKLIKLLQAKAIDVDGKDITEDIKVLSTGGYEYGDKKITGTPYKITLGVSSRVTNETVSVTRELTVLNDKEIVPKVELVGNSPIYVKLADGTEEKDIKKLIDPEILLYMNNKLEGVVDGKVKLLSDGGYDNNAVGTYYFTYEGTYDEDKSETYPIVASNIFEVIVTDDIEETQAAISIEAKEDLILDINAKFDAMKDPKVNAKSINDGDITEEVEVITNEVDTSKAGEYPVSYYVKDSEGLEAYKNIMVTVGDEEEDKDTEDKETGSNQNNNGNNSTNGNTNGNTGSSNDKEQDLTGSLVNTAITSLMQLVVFILVASILLKYAHKRSKYEAK